MPKPFRRRNANAADNTDNNNKTAIINSSKSNKYITNIPKHSLRVPGTDAGSADNTRIVWMHNIESASNNNTPGSSSLDISGKGAEEKNEEVEKYNQR